MTKQAKKSGGRMEFYPIEFEVSPEGMFIVYFSTWVEKYFQTRFIRLLISYNRFMSLVMVGLDECTYSSTNVMYKYV